MVQYRRNRVSGGTYFFTATLKDRHSMTLVEYVDVLRTAMARTLRERPFVIDAMMVLLEHCHVVWMLPPGDADYVGRWRRYWPA